MNEIASTAAGTSAGILGSCAGIVIAIVLSVIAIIGITAACCYLSFILSMISATGSGG
jgi:hypothetical protein